MDYNKEYKKVTIGIVTYNPLLSRLSKNIEAIIEQVEHLIIVDNASENIIEIEKLITNIRKKVYLVKNIQNMGIARALNQACQIGSDKGYNWILLLDQDSICQSNYINIMERYLDLPQAAILCPLICDCRSGKFILNQPVVNKVSQVKKAITSGSIVNLEVWEKLGKFDENMFIDSVDFEYCYRVNQDGKKIYLISEMTLDHELGEIKTKYFFRLKIHYISHNPLRYYYITKNIIYMEKKNRARTRYLRIIARESKNLFYILLDNEKRNDNIKAFWMGIRGKDYYDT